MKSYDSGESSTVFGRVSGKTNEGMPSDGLVKNGCCLICDKFSLVTLFGCRILAIKSLASFEIGGLPSIFL